MIDGEAKTLDLRLCDKVAVDECTHKVRGTKVEFKLKKQTAANWSGLTWSGGSQGPGE